MEPAMEPAMEPTIEPTMEPTMQLRGALMSAKDEVLSGNLGASAAKAEYKTIDKFIEVTFNPAEVQCSTRNLEQELEAVKKVLAEFENDGKDNLKAELSGTVEFVSSGDSHSTMDWNDDNNSTLEYTAGLNRHEETKHPSTTDTGDDSTLIFQMSMDAADQSGEVRPASPKP
jgi:hypothetical protein